jgi:hypothetical protein
MPTIPTQIISDYLQLLSGDELDNSWLDTHRARWRYRCWTAERGTLRASPQTSAVRLGETVEITRAGLARLRQIAVSLVIAAARSRTSRSRPSRSTHSPTAQTARWSAWRACACGAARAGDTAVGLLGACPGRWTGACG